MTDLGQLALGGALPALLWGVTAIFQKLSAQNLTPPGHYMAVFGAVICAAGIVHSLLSRDGSFNTTGLGYAALAGTTFALGAGLISFTLWKFATPISRLAPILSANVLATVLIGLLVLHEPVAPARLIGAAVLVVAGIVLVSLP